MCVCVCVCVVNSDQLYIDVPTFFTCPELREEDNADKPNDYVEQCIGRSEPVAKVGSISTAYRV